MMDKIIGLFIIGMACVSNALQVPGMWDIWDVGTGLLALTGSLTILLGDGGRGS